MASVSICMVTRDDAKFLERSLTPLQGLADEIIIVDLESKDETVKIASRFTPNVLVQPFENDLSAPRNSAIRKASMDWILYIDADEIIFKEELRALKKYLDKAEADAYILPTRSYTNNRRLLGWTSSSVMAGFEGFTLTKTLRLFRNFKGLGFRYPVNPTILPTVHAIQAKMAEMTDVVIHNLGYDPFEALRLDWLNSHVNAVPHDIANRYMLASILMQNGQLDQAKKHFGEIAKINAKFKRTLTNLGTILMMERRYDEAARVFTNAIEVDEKDVGAYNNLGVILKSAKNFEKAVFMFKKAIQLNPHDPRLFKALALTYIDKEDVETAGKVIKTGLSFNPKDQDLLKMSQDLSQE